MDCSSCHTQLPQGAKACPNCGTLTAAYHEPSGTSSDARTLPPSRPGISNTPSRSDKFNTPSTLDMNPYSNSLSNPYTTAPPPPPPQSNTSFPSLSPAPRPKNRMRWNIAAGILALILIGAGVFIFLSKSSSSTVAHDQSGASTSATQPINVSTSAIRLNATTAQKLYDSTTGSSPVMNEGLGAPDNYGWDHVAQANTDCTFTGGTYHAQAKPGYFAPCYASATNFSDLLLQVQMTIVSGHSGGVVFRADATNDHEYQFRISTDGTYILNKYVVENGTPAVKSLLSGTSSAIVKGANQSNLVAVLAEGDAIAVYINKKYVDSTNDATYHQGQIGVYADSDPSSVVDASFNKLEVWKL